MDEILPEREEEGGTKREGERATGGRGKQPGRQAKGEGEKRGGEGVFMVPTQWSKVPSDLN